MDDAQWLKVDDDDIARGRVIVVSIVVVVITVVVVEGGAVADDERDVGILIPLWFGGSFIELWVNSKCKRFQKA